jgi:hypothetical protein
MRYCQMPWGCQTGVKAANLATDEYQNKNQSYRNL